MTIDVTAQVSRSDGDQVLNYVFALESSRRAFSELGVTVRKKESTDERWVTVPVRVQ